MPFATVGAVAGANVVIVILLFINPILCINLIIIYHSCFSTSTRSLKADQLQELQYGLSRVTAATSVFYRHASRFRSLYPAGLWRSREPPGKTSTKSDTPHSPILEAEGRPAQRWHY